MVQIRKITILGALLTLVILLAGTASADLVIHDFEIKSTGEDDTVKPGEVLYIQFDVVNDGNYDIQDIELTLWFERGSTQLEDNEGVDIEPVFNLRDIDAGDDKSVNYELVIPWEVDDNERYDILVKSKGKNADDKTRETFEETLGNFKIEKDSHELYVDASFDPVSVDCGDEVILNIDVRNIGSNDEDDVNITAINSLIGVNVKELVYLDNDVEDKDNHFEKSYSFDVSNNINPGLYELTVRARFDDDYDENFKTISLTVDNCEMTQTTQPTQPTQPNDSTVTLPTNNQPTAPSGPSSVTTYVPAQPSDSSSKSSSNSTIIILVVVGEVGLVIIIVLVYLLVRKPKQPKLSDF